MFRLIAGLRRAVVCLLSAVALLLVLTNSARSEVLPPLRIPNLAIGTRCFGFLPCTGIDPFGLRLRAAALAVFRPEKGHDRDFYGARIQIAPSITLMQWAEIGVAIPITFYKRDIGVSVVYEPLQPFGRLRLPLEEILGGVVTTAFVRVHIASGPFVGGLPSATPDLMMQAMQTYRQQTQFEVGLALSKRIGPISATGSIATSVAAGRVEIYGGGERAYHFKIFHAFLQGQGIGIPKCPPEEAALNFCARGFRFGAGVRFDWDLGQGGIMVGTGSGAVEPGWTVGGQFGIDYDETTRRRHSDGVAAAHAWWERRFDALAHGWAEWKSAAAFWPDEEEAARRARPSRSSPLSDLFGPAGPPSSSPWLDWLLGDETVSGDPVFPDTTNGAQSVTPGNAANPAAMGSKPIATATRKPGHLHRSLRRGLFHDLMARAQQHSRIEREPGLLLPPDAGLMTNEDWNRFFWQREKERLVEEERLRRANTPTPLPDWGLVALNTVALAPYAMTFALLGGASHEGAAKVAEAKRVFRVFAYSAGEEEYGTAMEDALLTMFSMGGGAALSADLALARMGMMRAVEQGAVTAGERAAVQSAERTILGVAEEGPYKLDISRARQILAQARERLNPMNYECVGLGCNFGNVRYRGPKTSGTAAMAAESTEAAAARSGTEFTTVEEQRLADLLRERGHHVEPNKMQGIQGAGRQFDAYVDGNATEFKSLEPGANSNRIRHRVNESIRDGGQARNMTFDARNSGLTKEEAERGIRRAMGIARGKVDRITIFGDDYVVTN